MAVCFFKQKTAYELRISDWSSDVCSFRSRIVDRCLVDHGQAGVDGGAMLGIDRTVDGDGEHDAPTLLQPNERISPGRIIGREARPGDRDQEIGRASCRERVCQYV